MRFLFLLTSLLALSACTGVPKVQSLTEFYHPDNSQQLVKMSPGLALDLLKQDHSEPLLLEFSASWCEPCRHLVRPLRKLASEAQGRYRVVTVDVTSSLDAMEKFGVEKKLPAFLLQMPGSEEPVLRYGSGPTFAQIAQFLQSKDIPMSVPLTAKPLEKARAYKAMIVAGSSENANFLQEVYWNYSWLLQKGYTSSEIGCFYAKPDIIQYADDRKQFDDMKTIAAACHHVERKQLLDSIRLSLQDQPENFYLYVTSHGAAPIKPGQAAIFKENCLARAPALILDQNPPDCESNQGLTVQDLAEAMKNANRTKKYLVLQGCFTGGFISAKDDPKATPSALAALPNMRILTASSANQASFGCHSGAEATLFGSAYGLHVIEDTRNFDAMNWQDVYKNVQEEVSKLEKNLRLSGIKASDPQFFAN